MLKRVLIWTGVALVAIAITHTAWTASLKNKFEARLEEIRARGEPVEFAELEPPRPPDERNAAPLYEKALVWHDEHCLAVEYPDALLRCHEEWSEEDWAAARKWVESNARFIDMLHEAAARPDCWFELDWTSPLEMPMPLIRLSGKATQMLEIQALLDARGNGGSKRAMRHIEAIMKMARHQDRPTMISHLVRITLDGVAADTLKQIVVDPELDARTLRARLDPLFREAEKPGAWRDALLGERAMAIHIAYLSRAGKLEEYGGYFPLSTWPLRPLAYRDALALLDTWNEVLELSKKPYAQAHAGYESLEARTDARTFPYVLTKMYGALPGRFYEETVKHMARMRLARIGLALLGHKQETGSWPDALESSMPKDPYTSNPFYYERRGTGVRLAADAPIGPGDWREDYEELVWELD